MYNIVDRASIIGVSDTTILDNISMFYGQFYKYQTAPIGPKRLECPVYYENEIFLQHPGFMNYMVSTMGRVYSILDDYIIIHEKTMFGEHMVSLKLYENNYSYYPVSRLVKETFDLIPEALSSYVVYKDGCIDNLNLYNLEWVVISNTFQQEEKIQNTDNKPKRKKLEDNVIDKICKLLSIPLNSHEIAYNMNMICDENFQSLLTGLRKHRIYKHISDNYIFPETKNWSYRNDPPIEDCEIYAQLLSQNLRYSEIAVRTGNENTRRFRQILLRLKRGLLYPEIGKKYNIINL